MFGTHDLPLFIVTALVLIATPGVDMLYTVTRTLQFGWRAGLMAASGIITGCIVHTIAAAVGLAALLAASASAFTVIKWAGAAYLLWLAWGMLTAAVKNNGALARTRSSMNETRRRIFVQGFLTNVLNPKVALFFLALLPQFIDATASNKPLAFLFLGALFIIMGALFLFGLVALAHRARELSASRGARRSLNAIGGALFAVLAVRLAQAER